MKPTNCRQLIREINNSDKIEISIIRSNTTVVKFQKCNRLRESQSQINRSIEKVNDTEVRITLRNLTNWTKFANRSYVASPTIFSPEAQSNSVMAKQNIDFTTLEKYVD